MKNLLLSFLLVFIFINVYTQKTQDVLYLNNGNVIRGKILENNSEAVKIESYGRNVFVFNKTEIQNMAKEPTVIDFQLKPKGYYNFTSVGTVFGSALNDKPAPFSFLMEHNYRTCKYFALGAVTGIEFLNEAVMPLGGNIKLMLPASNGNTFFIGISGGYSISLETPEYLDDDNFYNYEVTEANGGVIFNSEAGAVFPIKNDLALFVAAGFRYNELNYKRADWSYTSVDRTMYFNRVSLRIGMAFH